MKALVFLLAVAAIVLALRLFYHSRHLKALRAWLRDPKLERLPAGSGVWEDAFAELHHVVKRREATQQQLGQALARFRAAGQVLPDGVVILDRENRIEWSNSTAAQHFGIDARRDAGQPVTNLVRQPDFVAYIEAGRFDEPLMLRLGGRGAALAIRIIAFGEDQKLLSSRDATAQERLDKMRRDFIANVSHELKTPVTVLSGFVETLANESLRLSPSQRVRYLGLMADQARRMQRLVDDLLTLSELESGTAAPDEQPVAMRPALERLAEEARALSGARHRIELAIEAESTVLGSARELHSAFSNLVSNAVRYTPEGGTVRLGWRIENGKGVFSVSDTGIGIAARHIPRLTERFYRVDSSRSRETGGTGLGLAIVKRALARHQAVLDVTSEVGRGSTFSAVFPASRVLAQSEHRSKAAA
jgi:two-component system, OmpR family, phosphate regulon sensor histidine kinase PhoR